MSRRWHWLVTFALALAVAALFEERLARFSAQRASEPAREESPRIRIARIERSPDPRRAPATPEPAAAGPTAKPTPATARLPRPAPEGPKPSPPRGTPAQAKPPRTSFVPTADAVARGRALLEAGLFPRLRATYARIGFPAYRDAMVALGARFFLYDARRRVPVAEVDPTSGRRLAGTDLAGLSRWPRDVTRHVSFALPTAAGGASRVVLLPPARVDAALVGAVERFASPRGLEASEIARLDLAYEIRDGRLRCEVLVAATRDGSETPLALLVDLGAAGR